MKTIIACLLGVSITAALQAQTNTMVATNAPFPWLNSSNYNDKVFQVVSLNDMINLCNSFKGKIIQWEVGSSYKPRQITEEVYCYRGIYERPFFMPQQAYQAFNRQEKLQNSEGKIIGRKKYLYAYVPDEALSERMLKDLQKACPDSDWARCEKLKNPLILIGNSARNSFGKMIYEWK